MDNDAVPTAPSTRHTSPTSSSSSVCTTTAAVGEAAVLGELQGADRQQIEARLGGAGLGDGRPPPPDPA
jgi:hypothetical protein